MRNAQDVQAALAQLAPELEVRFFDSLTATSQQAADNIGCELGQIVKSLLFIVDEQAVVVLASGDQRVDDRKLAALHEVTRKKIKIATAEQCVTILGYMPGSVPPIAHLTSGHPIWIDSQLQRYDQLYAAAGADNAIFPVTLPRLVEISGGRIADLHRE